MERQDANDMNKGTKDENVLITIKKAKWSWASHVMHKTDNGWKKKVTEWQLRHYKSNQGRQRIRWRDDIVAFPGTDG